MLSNTRCAEGDARTSDNDMLSIITTPNWAPTNTCSLLRIKINIVDLLGAEVLKVWVASQSMYVSMCLIIEQSFIHIGDA